MSAIVDHAAPTGLLRLSTKVRKSIVSAAKLRGSVSAVNLFSPLFWSLADRAGDVLDGCREPDQGAPIGIPNQREDSLS
jgi:hypothetical protein